jgi:hypothetical protein
MSRLLPLPSRRPHQETWQSPLTLIYPPVAFFLAPLSSIPKLKNETLRILLVPVLRLCEREWLRSPATRGCRPLPSRFLVLPTSMAVPPERPQPACAELPFQPAPQQLQHVPRGVDVPVPEVSLASTVDTAQDAPGALDYDLLARELRVTTLPHLRDLLRLLLGRLLLCSDPPTWHGIIFVLRPKPLCRHVGEFVNGRSVGDAPGNEALLGRHQSRHIKAARDVGGGSSLLYPRA